MTPELIAAITALVTSVASLLTIIFKVVPTTARAADSAEKAHIASNSNLGAITAIATTQSEAAAVAIKALADKQNV